MGKMESAIRDEVSRLARREIRKAVGPLLKERARLKGQIADLKKAVQGLEKSVTPLVRDRKASRSKLRATDEETQAARLSPGLVRKLRKRLGLSQEDLGLLADVTYGAVAAWEQGRSRPRADSRSAIVALRKLGKREVQDLLIIHRVG